mgnify:CR=1 FL=1
MKNILTILMIFLCFGLVAQKQKKQDIESILDMCGCHEVTFNFAETFSPVEDYEFHENYRSSGIEYVLPVEQSKDKIVLQHLLIIGDTMIIKHWRQDWLYENQDLFVYDADKTWNYESLEGKESKGQWTQKVYQVDDGPRYEGSGTWVHVDGKHYWENTTMAPLPRREFSKRSDYNIMKRKNRHEITDYGWVHEQDNDKLIKENDEYTLLAEEKGWNTYKKIDPSKCELAEKWWSEKEVYWADVRKVWDQLYAKKKDLKFKSKVDDKPLWSHLFALQDELLTDQYDSEAATQKIAETIQLFLKDDLLLVTN